jgi:site-specific DNA-cytosine methylase
MTPTSSGKNWRVRKIDESQTITTDPSPTGRLGGDVVMERFPVDVYNAQIYPPDAPTPTMTTGTGIGNASGPKVGERLISLHATQDPITNEEVFPALGTGGGAGSLAVAIPDTVMAVRKLTPLECERLQGFPDNWTQISWRNKSIDKCPNGHRYKAMGNSMAVPVMHWIGARLDVVDKLMRGVEE